MRASNPSWRLTAGVYLARQDDIVRILDMDRGRFYGLDTVASLLLSLALERGPDGAASEVARIYGVEQDRVRADLEGLRASLHQRRLLANGEVSHAPVRRWLPGWPVGPCRVRGSVTARLAGRLLRRAWRSLRLSGWASTLWLWQRPAGPTLAVGPEEAEALITTVDDAIRDAAARQLLFPVACKERAVVGYHLLRGVYALPAELVIGVQHYPFGVHAWVEIGRRTVTDDEAHCAAFAPVARFA